MDEEILIPAATLEHALTCLAVWEQERESRGFPKGSVGLVAAPHPYAPGEQGWAVVVDGKLFDASFGEVWP